MKSLAIKYNDQPEVAGNSIGSPKEYFPTLNVSDKQIPELKDMSVGDQCYICLRVKVTGIRSDNDGTRYELDCLKGEYVEREKDKKDDAEY